MADIYVKSGGGSIGSGSYRGNWTASQTYALGDRVCGVATSDYWMFECTNAGTAGGTEPTWTKTDGSTSTDNTVTWTARIPDAWADATLTLAKAAANDAAGDTIYVAHDHNETGASNVTLSIAGTASSPVRIICADTSTNATATSGAMTVTGGTNITFNGFFYCYGIAFTAGSSGSAHMFYLVASSSPSQFFENCSFSTLSTYSSGAFYLTALGANTASSLTLKNCTFKFGHASQSLVSTRCAVNITGGSIASGSSAITKFIGLSENSSYVRITDFDFTNAASSMNLVSTTATCQSKIDFINCKLPASWSGGIVSAAITAIGFRASMYNCDSGATNYRLWIETYAGSIKSETTLVKTGGASDGTTAISWKLVTSANSNETVAPLITDDMAIWIDSTGSSKTITVDILHDSTTALTDAEVWLEIDYLSSSAQPLGTPASDKRATVLTTATAQTTSSATWTTTGMTNPNKQKLEVTFTPQMKGFVYARVCLAKASYTIYVDPEPVIS